MKTYLVVGGSSGIGENLVELLSKEKHNLIVTYNEHVPQQKNINSRYVKFNSLEDTFDVDTLPEVLDGLVYLPGSVLLKPFKRISSGDFRLDFEKQVIGFIELFKQVEPFLKKSPEASVVGISSVAANSGYSMHTSISTIKSAMEGLFLSLAAEYSPKIRFNCIAPSLCKTPLTQRLWDSEAKVEHHSKNHPLKRIGESSDISNAIRFLLSKESSWITGQTLAVDGGISTIRV